MYGLIHASIRFCTSYVNTMFSDNSARGDKNKKLYNKYHTFSSVKFLCV